ncbi:MAG: MBL fold metallo-hydrolase [Myxococcota bacterium]
MFARPAIHRNALPVLACLMALGLGCGVRQFLRMEQVEAGPKLSFFLGGGGNSAALLHDGVAFLVDPKFRPASRRVRQVLEEELGREVRRVVLTHSHGDHASGVELYPGAVVLAHPATRARLEAEGVQAGWVEVPNEVRLSLGGEAVRVLYLGGGHTDGDLVVLFEARRLLVAGDLVLERNEPVIDEKAGGDPLALRQTLDRLLELDFERVLPGHGQPVARERVQRVRDYLKAVEEAVRTARARGVGEDAMAGEVKVAGFDDFEPVPFRTDRAETIRLMARAVQKEGPRPVDP